jgi:hypothetical protein
VDHKTAAASTFSPKDSFPEKLHLDVGVGFSKLRISILVNGEWKNQGKHFPERCHERLLKGGVSASRMYTASPRIFYVSVVSVLYHDKIYRVKNSCLLKSYNIQQ